jgi:sugar-specific transcriptional regulator TrmB
MRALERRDALLGWMRDRSVSEGWTAYELAEQSGVYRGLYRYERCFEDLKALERKGRVRRSLGRPARWSVSE